MAVTEIGYLVARILLKDLRKMYDNHTEAVCSINLEFRT